MGGSVAFGAARTGFEYYLDLIEPGDFREPVARCGSHTITTRTGSDIEELRAALAFLKVAARLGDGALFLDDGQLVRPEAVSAYLDEQTGACEAMMLRQHAPCAPAASL